ncbi:hypothetical protein IT774_15535 [Salinimonas marina]|uniref:Uncharacterized protein n=1 Tax=Salinimonas marina TaxID=2785918 RepID=A0A7S9DWX3_9ALTE|nr:hypothetical protein [Salinimonas marina]QPG05484.1 hypothetical protein IT774_15535 [Salinimonas marina]
MTLNQLPTLATRLMQAKYTAPQVSHLGYRTIPPQAIDTDSLEAGSHTAAAFASAFRKRQGKTPQRHSKAITKIDYQQGDMHHYAAHTSGPLGSWAMAAEETERQYASALSEGHASAPVEDTIQLLREEALIIQLMILREHRSRGQSPSPALFNQLDKVQKVLQQEVEQQAHKLQEIQPATQRSGNLLDAHG